MADNSFNTGDAGYIPPQQPQQPHDTNPDMDLDAPAQFTVRDYLTVIQGFQNLTQTLQQQQNASAQLFWTQEAAMQSITNHLASLSTNTPPSQPAPTTTTAATTTAILNSNLKPVFNQPLIFKGKSTDIELFINSIDNGIELQLSSLPTDHAKCIYMASFFGEGSPKQWYHGIKLTNTNLMCRI
jgi:hypothetical protein